MSVANVRAPTTLGVAMTGVFEVLIRLPDYSSDVPIGLFVEMFRVFIDDLIQL